MLQQLFDEKTKASISKLARRRSKGDSLKGDHSSGPPSKLYLSDSDTEVSYLDPMDFTPPRQQRRMKERIRSFKSAFNKYRDGSTKISKSSSPRYSPNRGSPARGSPSRGSPARGSPSPSPIPPSSPITKTEMKWGLDNKGHYMYYDMSPGSTTEPYIETRPREYDPSSLEVPQRSNSQLVRVNSRNLKSIKQKKAYVLDGSEHVSDSVTAKAIKYGIKQSKSRHSRQHFFKSFSLLVKLGGRAPLPQRGMRVSKDGVDEQWQVRRTLFEDAKLNAFYMIFYIKTIC